MVETLLLIRHGQSQANANGPFTGLLDAHLIDVGREEVAHGADLLYDAELWARVCFCSPPLWARQIVAMIYARLSCTLVRTGCDWPLAERNYVAFTGGSKRDVPAEHEVENFRVWRSAVYVAPPPMPREQLRILNHVREVLGLTKSLHDAITHVNDVWRESSEPTLRQAGAVLGVTHGDLVRDRFGSAGLGDEGGFAPQIEDPRQALDLLVDANTGAGYTPGPDDVAIALDPAANSFYLGAGQYGFIVRELARAELVDYYLDLFDSYPIRSLEDGFAEEDPEGWVAMAEASRGRVQLVGDDLYCTDPDRIRDGAEQGYSNAVLIKPNQIGTVSQTFDAIATAHGLVMACMVSHRSGETGDTFIADLVIGTGVGQSKSGAPVRGERVAKYNRLTEIELDDPDLPYGLVRKIVRP